MARRKGGKTTAELEKLVDAAVGNGGKLLQELRICRCCRRESQNSTAGIENLQMLPQESPEIYCRNGRVSRSCRRSGPEPTAEMKNLRIVPKESQEGYCRNEGFADHAVENAVILLQKWGICESYRRNRRESTAEMKKMQIMP